jgi:hypothetical protein
MKANLITVICLSLGMFLFPSCKKEKKEDNTPPPLTAAGLSSGKAGMRFTTTESFKGSMSFDIRNTENTSATTKPLFVNSTIRQIDLEATEMKDNLLNRKIDILIMVPNTASTTNGTITISIDGNGQAGTPPLAIIGLEAYYPYLRSSYWSVTSGTLAITRLTATEIEGTFSGAATSSSTLSGPLTISDGLFAGKF